MVSLLQCQNDRKLWRERGRKSENTDAKMKAKTKSQNAATIPWSPRQGHWIQERGTAVSKAKKVHGCLTILRILVVGEVFETPLTFSNSFNIHFDIFTLLTLCCTWLTIQKHVPHLLTVMHMCQFKGYWDAREACTVNMYTYVVYDCDTGPCVILAIVWLITEHLIG